MKKLSVFAIAFAVVLFAACGGNKSAQNTEGTDSVKSFEQEQIEASIKMHFDSIASEVGKLKQFPFLQAGEARLPVGSGCGRECNDTGREVSYPECP